MTLTHTEKKSHNTIVEVKILALEQKVDQLTHTIQQLTAEITEIKKENQHLKLRLNPHMATVSQEQYAEIINEEKDLQSNF